MLIMNKPHPLKNIRESEGLTQREMAAVLGVSLSMYEKVERGSMKPSRGFIEKTKKRFPHFSVDYIFFNN